MMLSTGAQTLAFDSETIFSSLFDGAQSSATDLSDSGYALQRLGLVAGGEDGDLMLDKIGSRSEALTLFIALLGERNAATSVSYSYTFRDIPDWFGNFAGYGVYRSYTSGYSETQFGSYDAVTPQAYATFMLRALGYDTSDFTWSAALDKAVEIGLCTRQQADKWLNEPFRRQEIMESSYLALSTKLKNSDCTLTDKLIAAGKLTAAQAKQENLKYGTVYSEAPTVNNGGSNVARSKLPSGSYELHNTGTGLVMTASAAKQANVSAAADVNGANQLFTIQNNSDGSFQLLSKSNTGLAVDANPTDGAEVILWNDGDKRQCPPDAVYRRIFPEVEAVG